MTGKKAGANQTHLALAFCFNLTKATEKNTLMFTMHLGKPHDFQLSHVGFITHVT